jgi:hypothetical protein
MLKYTKLKVICRAFNFVQDSVSESFIEQYEPTYFDAETVPQELWQRQPIQFKYTFDLSGNVITTKFTNVTENRIISQSDVDISIFKTAGIYTTETVTENNIATVKLVDLTELYKNIPNGRRHFYDTIPIKFLVVKSNPTIDDIIILIKEPCAPQDEADYRHPSSPNDDDLSDYAIHSITVDGTGINNTSYINTVEDLNINTALPTITTTSTVSGDIVTVNVTCPLVSEIKLTSNTGYLPKTTIPLTNGVGSFKVLTTGLDTGDTVDVDIGYGIWPSVVKFTKTI